MNLKEASSSGHAETLLVRCLNKSFRRLGEWISLFPWVFIIGTFVVTLITSSVIPFTKMTNDVSDFTPYAARARAELKVYEDFFSREGEPITAFVMITSKNNGSMLGVSELSEAVQILDMVNNDIYLKSSTRNESLSFLQFCSSFCEINEPVRHFYNGLKISKEYNGSTPLLDLGYPITTVLGRKFHTDTCFFGVKVAIEKENGKKEIITLNEMPIINGHSILNNEELQVANNVKDIRLVLLQFRAEKPAGFSNEDVERYEQEVVSYIRRSLNPVYVDVTAFSPYYVTSEIVRAGLSILPFVLVGFGIMCLFSTASVSLSAMSTSQMNFEKVILSVVACVCPFMAVGTALGLLFWFGLKFGSILCVIPFLVLAIGVDDAFLMIGSWQRITGTFRKYPQLSSSGDDLTADVSLRVGMMLQDIGPSMSITTLTNVLAFGIGALTPTPEIRIFCIGGVTAIIVDFLYQITFYTAVVAVLARREIHREATLMNESVKKLKKAWHPKHNVCYKIMKRMLSKYCTTICTLPISLIVICALFAYWYISIIGAINMKVELTPQKLFTEDSDVLNVIRYKNDYIQPYYSTYLVFVSKPGDIRDPRNRLLLNNLVEEFESLPTALGRFSTKFWLRDYEDFIQFSDPHDDGGDEISTRNITNGNWTEQAEKDDFLKFLKWPEFRTWRGFVQYHLGARNKVVLDKFFFITAAHGEGLRDWSNRALLMKQLRAVGDRYPQFEVSVYEDDAKFLDLIETLVPQTVQSSVCTLICMSFVCFFFMKEMSAIIFATLSIVSTAIGVFGILSHWGVGLDPIVMSAVIMSIGFSVDIPAHVTYHFAKARGDSIAVRLQHCLSAIAYPVLQAAFSTLLCVSCVLFVRIHMATVFVKTIFLVIAIGLLHGLLVIPVLFYITSLIPSLQSLSGHKASLSKAHIFICNADPKT